MLFGLLTMILNKLKFYLFHTFSLFTILFLISCTATNQVRTVGKGKTGLEITLGGPMFTNLGAPIPIPNLFVGARYGLRQDLDLAAYYNLTGPIIPGIGFDVITSIFWIPIQPGLRNQEDTPKKGWGAGGSFMLQWVTDFKHGLIILPAMEIGGGWRNKWFNPFIGTSVGLNFYRPHNKTPIVQLNPFLGSDFIINERASIALKCTIYESIYNLYGSQIEWVHIANKPEEKKKYGVFGVALGFSYNFGNSKRKPKKK